MNITVFGPGCDSCVRLEGRVRAAVAKLGVDAIIERVTDLRAINTAGVMVTPGLMVDDEIVTVGRVPSLQEVIEYVGRVGR